MTILVTPALKDLAKRIAEAMTTQDQRWTETDAWEIGLQCLAKRADVRDALAAQAEKGGE